MRPKKKQCIFFVDDEPAVRMAVAGALKYLEYDIVCFANAAECLEKLPQYDCSLLIADVNMPGMDGLTLLDKVKHIAPWIPVIVVTAYGDVPMAVRAMKAGAVNFIEKPLKRPALLKIVESVLQQSSFADSSAGHTLTKAEKKILKMILDGNSNKEIAYKLDRAVRTVEEHRSHIMRKFNADSIVDLVKKAAKLDFSDTE
ncbi:MAG: response regulator transcription factor [Planctomycetes bacterium]|nr:response regulator transcription factor [Planctomycetota bacterium]